MTVGPVTGPSHWPNWRAVSRAAMTDAQRIALTAAELCGWAWMVSFVSRWEGPTQRRGYFLPVHVLRDRPPNAPLEVGLYNNGKRGGGGATAMPWRLESNGRYKFSPYFLQHFSVDTSLSFSLLFLKIIFTFIFLGITLCF